MLLALVIALASRATAAGAIGNGALQPAREPKSGHADVKGVPADDGKTHTVKSPAHVARDARDASIGLNTAPGEGPPRVWAPPQLGAAGTQPAAPGAAPDEAPCVGPTCARSSADNAKDLVKLCPGHPGVLRSDPQCETKTVSSTWVVGGAETHADGPSMDRRTMWIVRASKKNVPGCSTFLSHPCGIENCVTANVHGACVKPKPGTCAAACKDVYGKQGTYIKGLEPFVDAQCGFTYNATYRPEENITAYGESRGGTRWGWGSVGGKSGPESNISQCSCFTGRHIEADVKYNQLNGSRTREYVALCEDEAYVAAPGREHPFEKRDVRRDGEIVPNLEALNGTPSQTNMPSRRDGESTGALTCFPSASTVTLADGVTHVRMDELRHGDAVRAVTRDGKLTTDTVSFLSLANAAAVATFVRITTEGGEVVTLTPEHRLPVGEACCGTLKQAKGVERGDMIWVAAGGGGAAPAPQRIAATARVEAKGQHSPVLTHGTFPLVEEACVTNPLADVALTAENFDAMEAMAMAADAACSRAGVVTAFDSLGYVDLASYGVPLLEPICKAMGMCSAVRRALLGAGGSYVQIR